MNQFKVPLICLAGFLFSAGAVFAVNYDNFVVENKHSGTLYYFARAS